MKPLVKRCLILFFLLTLKLSDALAQCAMCRATVENNVSNGDTTIGAGLNFGILYLFSMPYLIVAVVGFLWYRKSKSDSRKKQYRQLVSSQRLNDG